MADEKLLIAGAYAYAQAFKKVPPAKKQALELELEDLPTDARNLITAALWEHPYEAFIGAVRRELVKPV